VVLVVIGGAVFSTGLARDISGACVALVVFVVLGAAVFEVVPLLTVVSPMTRWSCSLFESLDWTLLGEERVLRKSAQEDTVAPVSEILSTTLSDSLSELSVSLSLPRWSVSSPELEVLFSLPVSELSVSLLLPIALSVSLRELGVLF
jgi:hypothetical protein